ncbi:hypothetical protein LguiB_017894 [Lonicera macranthoides]
MYFSTHLYSFLIKKNPKFHEPMESLHNDILPCLTVLRNHQWDGFAQRHANKRAPLNLYRLIFQLYAFYELDELLTTIYV